MGFSQQEIKASIPKHLQQFVEEQDYSKYTAQEHAVWRFIMRQQMQHLSCFAHPVYGEGLRKTGISVEHIPSIEEMNACLSKLGWRAVVVNGFIPPAAFVEFHCHRIMPIALDMRTIEHVLYTPSPDIVHEAGGHAPFLADVDYGEYLQKFGEYGMKAIYTQKDMDVYEAIRLLSILKEDPTATAQQVEDATRDLVAKSKASDSAASETTRLSRLYWWTAEYGLVGTPDDYKIFGAGLLSSFGESRSCLDDKKVKKIPLTVDASQVSYDITEPQPQLFVTRSCRHMMQILEEFADQMCFRRGGAASMKIAQEAGIVASCVYSSGLEVSGKIKNVSCNCLDEEIYFATEGPTQLAYKGQELEGHGLGYHAQGFGSPVGMLQNIDRPLEDLSVDELKTHGITTGQDCELDFLSGIRVRGHLENILRQDHKNLILTFTNCTVTDLRGDTLFRPEWGNYDMAVGNHVVSVYAGSADPEKFNTFPPKSKRNVMPKKYSREQRELFSLYQNVRDMRESQKIDATQLQQISKTLDERHAKDWLLRLEILELLSQKSEAGELTQHLKKSLEALKKHSAEYGIVIESGLSAIQQSS